MWVVMGDKSRRGEWGRLVERRAWSGQGCARGVAEGELQRHSQGRRQNESDQQVIPRHTVARHGVEHVPVASLLQAEVVGVGWLVSTWGVDHEGRVALA